MIGTYIVVDTLKKQDAWEFEVTPAQEACEDFIVLHRNRYPDGGNIVIQPERVGALVQADGTVYMIMSLGQDTDSVANSGLLDIQSHVITVEGTTYNLDGINYIMIDSIVEDQGITNLTHQVIGVLPGEARP